LKNPNPLKVDERQDVLVVVELSLDRIGVDFMYKSTLD